MSGSGTGAHTNPHPQQGQTGDSGFMQGVKETLHNVGTAMGLTKAAPLDANETPKTTSGTAAHSGEPRMSGAPMAAPTAGTGPTASGGMNRDMGSQALGNSGHLNPGTMGSNTGVSLTAAAGASCCATGCKCGSNCTCGSECTCRSCGGADKHGKLNQQEKQMTDRGIGSGNKSSVAAGQGECCANGCKCGSNCSCGAGCSCCQGSEKNQSGAENAQAKIRAAVANAGKKSGNEQQA